MKVIFDNNIWISYAIGHHLSDVPVILKRPDVALYACAELFAEFQNAVQYPKLVKILRPERVMETFELMSAKAFLVSITERSADFKDAKDNYLLDLCAAVKADYLITGDKPLLALEQYDQTSIVTYRDFRAMLGM
jgi:uncharacterized protein